MSSLIDIEVEGEEELKAKINRLANRLSSAELLPILKEAAAQLRDEIKASAPIGPTGNLKRAIVAKPLKDRFTLPTAAITAVDYKIAPHMYLVEYGHGGPHPAEPHPYFHPIVQDRSAATLRWIHDRINQIVESEVAKS